MPDDLSPDDLAAKTAFRMLVGKYGGQDAAAAAINGDQSQISRWCSHNHPSMPRVDVVMRLEGILRDPVVTRLLADRLGFLLVPKAVAEVSIEAERLFARAQSEAADVIKATADRAADDVILRELQQSNEANASLEAHIRAKSTVTPLHRKGV